jgi:hypothetical protein
MAEQMTQVTLPKGVVTKAEFLEAVRDGLYSAMRERIASLRWPPCCHASTAATAPGRLRRSPPPMRPTSAASGR